MDLMFRLLLAGYFSVSLQDCRNNQLLYQRLWGPTVTYIYFKNGEKNNSSGTYRIQTRTHVILFLSVPRVVLFKKNVSVCTY